MMTMTKARKSVKASTPRTVKVLARPTFDTDGRLLVDDGKECAVYFVAEIPTEIPGRAFSVKKFAGDEYATLVGADPADSSCDCKGHTYHGHCRHVEALTALTARNLI